MPRVKGLNVRIHFYECIDIWMQVGGGMTLDIYSTAAYILIVASAAAALISFLGCCGAHTVKHCTTLKFLFGTYAWSLFLESDVI